MNWGLAIGAVIALVMVGILWVRARGGAETLLQDEVDRKKAAKDAAITELNVKFEREHKEVQNELEDIKKQADAADRLKRSIELVRKLRAVDQGS